MPPINSSGKLKRIILRASPASIARYKLIYLGMPVEVSCLPYFRHSNRIQWVNRDTYVQYLFATACDEFPRDYLHRLPQILSNPRLPELRASLFERTSNEVIDISSDNESLLERSSNDVIDISSDDEDVVTSSNGNEVIVISSDDDEESVGAVVRRRERRKEKAREVIEISSDNEGPSRRADPAQTRVKRKAGSSFSSSYRPRKKLDLFSDSDLFIKNKSDDEVTLVG